MRVQEPAGHLQGLGDRKQEQQQFGNIGRAHCSRRVLPFCLQLHVKSVLSPRIIFSPKVELKVGAELLRTFTLPTAAKFKIGGGGGVVQN